MRITVLILGLLAALSAAGCARESIVSTAPVPTVQETEPIRAHTVAELAVERRMAEISATSNPLSQVALSACEFDVPPEVFGVLVDNRLFFAAVKATSGDVSGLFSYSQSVEGESFNFAGRITCMHLYDFDGGTLNRAKLGGVVDWTDDETIPVGTFIWWQTIDNRLSPGNLHDKSTLSGFGDEAANEAFCNSPDPPRFGPWDVDKGDIRVRDLDGVVAAN